MELIAAILLAGPLGFFIRSRRVARASYLVASAVIFPIQTVVVHHASPDDINVSYFVINVIIVAAGVGLNALGARLRARRAHEASALADAK
jgi:hypothetical protein